MSGTTGWAGSLRCTDARDEPVHTGIAFCLAFILVIVPHPVLRALLAPAPAPDTLLSPQSGRTWSLGAHSSGMPGGRAPERVVSAWRAPAHQVALGVTGGAVRHGRPSWGALHPGAGSQDLGPAGVREKGLCSVVKRKTGRSTRRRLHTVHIPPRPRKLCAGCAAALLSGPRPLLGLLAPAVFPV